MPYHPAKTLPVEIAIFERQISQVQCMLYIYGEVVVLLSAEEGAILS